MNAFDYKTLNWNLVLKFEFEPESEWKQQMGWVEIVMVWLTIWSGTYSPPHPQNVLAQIQYCSKPFIVTPASTRVLLELSKPVGGHTIEYM